MQKHDKTDQKESVRKYSVNAIKSEKNVFFFLDSLEELNQKNSFQCLLMSACCMSTQRRQDHRRKRMLNFSF